MAQRRRHQAPVQAEHRHQVVLLQDLRQRLVDVRRVAGVEPAGRHPAAPELGVQVVGVAVAVLVGRDRDQVRLGLVVEPGQRPHRRVLLAHVVDRPLPQQRLDLVALGLALHEARQRLPAGVGGAQVEEDLGEVLAIDQALLRGLGEDPGPVAPPLLEVVLEVGTHSQQRRVPLQGVVDTLEPAVVQLVEHPQRQGGVVVGVSLHAAGDPATTEAVGERLGQGAARGGERGSHRASPSQACQVPRQSRNPPVGAATGAVRGRGAGCARRSSRSCSRCSRRRVMSRRCPTRPTIRPPEGR